MPLENERKGFPAIQLVFQRNRRNANFLFILIRLLQGFIGKQPVFIPSCNTVYSEQFQFYVTFRPYIFCIVDGNVHFLKARRIFKFQNTAPCLLVRTC